MFVACARDTSSNNCTARRLQLCKILVTCVIFTVQSCMYVSATALSCTFESGDCGWTKGGKRMWKRGNSTLSSGTGTDRAQGGSAFMYLETSSPSTAGDVSFLYSPQFKADSVDSISWWFHMHGTTIGSLALESRRGQLWTELWIKVGEQPNAWASSHTVLLPRSRVHPEHGCSQVRFKGTRGAGYTGDICIDEITAQASTKDCECSHEFVLTGRDSRLRVL